MNWTTMAQTLIPLGIGWLLSEVGTGYQARRSRKAGLRDRADEFEASVLRDVMAALDGAYDAASDLALNLDTAHGNAPWPERAPYVQRLGRQTFEARRHLALLPDDDAKAKASKVLDLMIELTHANNTSGDIARIWKPVDKLFLEARERFGIRLRQLYKRPR
ncbi:hypothetical protein [Micromonospora sp. NPDC006431]|uniref:hypothetical protein n=1 Tax=Micromonospora sp. NPDC006431 TaxID=3364235 RepID=UPI0036C90001